jgi:hypothetical protein
MLTNARDWKSCRDREAFHRTCPGRQNTLEGKRFPRLSLSFRLRPTKLVRDPFDRTHASPHLAVYRIYARPADRIE